MKKLILSVLLIAIFIFIACIIIIGYIHKSNVENHGVTSVGKYILHDSWGKGETNTFEFYYEGNKFTGNGGRAPKGFSKNIGKFYEISISKKYIGTIKAHFDKEIKDSLKIIEAGFPINEITKEIP